MDLSRGLRTHALLLAGLVLLGLFSRAGRAAAEAPDPVSSSVQAPAPDRAVEPPPWRMAVEELKDMNVRLAGLEKKLGDQGHQLDDLAAQVKALSLDTEKIKRDELDGLKRLLDKQAADISSLAEGMDASQRKMSQSLKDLEGMQADLQDKRDRMAGISDLLAVMKKDLNNNSQEIVDIKGELAAMGKKAPDSGPSEDFITQAARWPWLPAVATGLSVVAVILALR